MGTKETLYCRRCRIAESQQQPEHILTKSAISLINKAPTQAVTPPAKRNYIMQIYIHDLALAVQSSVKIL